MLFFIESTTVFTCQNMGSSPSRLNVVECSQQEKVLLNDLYDLQLSSPKVRLVPMKYHVSSRRVNKFDKLLVNGYARLVMDNILIPKVIIQLFMDYYVIFEEWDAEWKSESMEIQQKLNYRIMCLNNSEMFHIALGMKNVKYGQHHWRLRLNKYRSNWGNWRNIVGVVKSERITKAMLESKKCLDAKHGYFYIGWLNSRSCSAVTSDNVENMNILRQYGRVMVMFGDIVDIYLDLEYGALSFALNGIYFGIAQRIDINTQYRLCVILNGKSSSFDILSYTQQR